jgi:RNA polymerase sigma-70 factor (ECF subfamily)
MPTPDDSNLTKYLVAFLCGDRRAGGNLYKLVRPAICVVARSRAPDLRNDIDDIVNEVFLMMLESPHRFDSTRGSARVFITSILVPEAVERVRSKMARPGTTTRRRDVGRLPLTTFPRLDPVPLPELIPAVGYGSPEAIEAVCEAHAILSRVTPPMRLIIGGLMEGKTQSEISYDTSFDRFRVIRMIAGLQRQFAAVA